MTRTTTRPGSDEDRRRDLLIALEAGQRRAPHGFGRPDAPRRSLRDRLTGVLRRR